MRLRLQQLRRWRLSALRFLALCSAGKKVSNLTLAVPRSYKNSEGEYETDFIPCVLWQGIAENVVNYCKKGDLVGVKGRVQAREYTTEEAQIGRAHV